MVLREEKVFKDPVHNYIYVRDPIIWDLINTKEFQRLRRIRQMGTSFFTFHGAEHSRFSHSLGVYEITRKVISQFERHAYADWPKEEGLLCLCAALLHDVGHGPFSHSIEKAFNTNHEAWSCRIVLGDTEINKVLKRVSPDFPEQVARVIDNTYENNLVLSLITSQLDADRMDYLLRDAYYTGVNYGTFDLERILRVVRPYRGNIVVKESGMHAVEDYLMSRYQMYWQVYFHPVTRSSEILLDKLFLRAKVLYDKGYRFRFLMSPLPQLFENRLTVEEYLEMDESLIQMTMMQWMKEDDSILADLCERFLNRRLFKYISLPAERSKQVDDIKAKVTELGFDPAYYLEVDVASDLPYDVYEPDDEVGKLPIVILTEQEELVEISKLSDIVRSISGNREGTHYLFYPEECLLT